METNALFTGFLLPKILADKYNLKDVNDFVLKSFLIDKTMDNKMMSIVFQMITAKNSEVKETVESEINEITISTTSFEGEMKELKEDVIDVKKVSEDIITKVEEATCNILSPLDEIKTEVAVLKESDVSITASIQEVNKSINSLPLIELKEQMLNIEKHIDGEMKVENEELLSLFKSENIYLQDYKNRMFIEQIEKAIDSVDDEEFQQKLLKLRKSKSKDLKSLRESASLFESILNVEVLEKIKETVDSVSVSFKDQATILMNLISPLNSFISEVNYKISLPEIIKV